MMGTEESKATPQQSAADMEMQLLCLDRQAELGTYLSKRSYMCGWIDLYAPDAPPAEWNTKSWKLKIEKDPETGSKKSYRLKPMHAHEAFRHNGLIPYRKDWHATPPAMPTKLTPEPIPDSE